MDADSPPPTSHRYAPAAPLWRLVPVSDADGAPAADFMMVIPRLSRRGAAFAAYATSRLRAVCEAFGEQVLFADINHATGAIWISVPARPGLCADVASAIRRELPEALSVGGQLVAMRGLAPGGRGWRAWISRIPRLGVRLRALCPPDSDPR